MLHENIRISFKMFDLLLSKPSLILFAVLCILFSFNIKAKNLPVNKFSTLGLERQQNIYPPLAAKEAC